MLQLPHAKAVTSMFHRVQLRKDVVPKTAENFRALCTGGGSVVCVVFELSSCQIPRCSQCLSCQHHSSCCGAYIVTWNFRQPLATTVQLNMVC